MEFFSEALLDTLIFKLVIAFFIGAFIGLRREIDLQKEGSESFVGFRTMPLVVIMGALSTQIPGIPFAPGVFVLAIIVFLLIAYYNGVTKLKLIGLTSEFATIIMFLVGVFVGYGEFMIGIVLTVLVAILTSFKTELHTFARGISIKEWGGALQLLIISFVVLPFLPHTAVDPWGIIIPFEIWLLVIFISGIGFTGYFLAKYIGAKHSMPLTAFLGSLVSSTAVTTALAIDAKKHKDIHTSIFTLSLLVASVTMLARTLFTIIVVAPTEFYFLAIPIITMMIVAGGAAYYLNRKTPIIVSEKTISPELKSPFQIMPALQFAALFVTILICVAAIREYVGEFGILFVSFVTALIDVDAIVLSSIQGFRAAEFSFMVVAWSIMIAILINTLVKLGYVWALSRPDFAKQASLYIGGTVLVGLVTTLVVLV